MSRRLRWVSTCWVLAVVLSTALTAQRGGRGVPIGPAQGRTPSNLDLTGYWVSLVTEDWVWRMVLPPKSSYPSIPLNAEGRKVADAWDPRTETAADKCKAYGAGNIMRVPTRLRVSWQSENVLKVETDAGQQVRLFDFAPSAPPAAATLQGVSRATWEYSDQRTVIPLAGFSAEGQLAAAGGTRGRAAGGRGEARPGQLRVVTTGFRPGYLQRNGVPYSGNAVVTEYFNVAVQPTGDRYLIVTTIVEDPQYLNTPFARSSHFKKEADGSKWSPTPCE